MKLYQGFFVKKGENFLPNNILHEYAYREHFMYFNANLFILNYSIKIMKFSENLGQEIN